MPDVFGLIVFLKPESKTGISLAWGEVLLRLVTYLTRHAKDMDMGQKLLAALQDETIPNPFTLGTPNYRIEMGARPPEGASYFNDTHLVVFTSATGKAGVGVEWGEILFHALNAARKHEEFKADLIDFLYKIYTAPKERMKNLLAKKEAGLFNPDHYNWCLEPDRQPHEDQKPRTRLYIMNTGGEQEVDTFLFRGSPEAVKKVITRDFGVTRFLNGVG